MNVEHTDDCGRERKAKGNVVTDPDTHMTPELKERVRTHWGAEGATQNAGSELQGFFVDAERVRVQRVHLSRRGV
jgi:hypothetical protein